MPPPLQSVATLLLIVGGLASVSGDRIKGKIYKPIEDKFFCFRRMNATHQIGCNTAEGGNVGVIHLVNDDNDMAHVLTSGQNWPYVPVISPKYYKTHQLNRFKQKSVRISGVLVLADDPEPNVTELSDDQSCPNQYHDLYSSDSALGHCKTLEWNLPNDLDKRGILFIDWPFPIFLIKNQSSVADIKDCFSRFGGSDYPLCAVQLKAPMSAAKDSVTCLRRTALSRSSYSLSHNSFCDPLGGTNIFSTLYNTSMNSTADKPTLFLLSARLDSFTMFDNLSPGADSSIVSVITLLSVADTLNKMKSTLKRHSFSGANVMYAFFDGEAFDYIGSSRMVYDMKRGAFPVEPSSQFNMARYTLNDFYLHADLNQLAPHTNSSPPYDLWLHTDSRHSNDSRYQEIRQSLESAAQMTQTIRIKVPQSGQPLPPSSVQTVLREHNGPKVPASVVLTNHQGQYANKYYNSIYDTIHNVNRSGLLSQTLTDISTLVTKMTYRMLTGVENQSIAADPTLVEKLIDCYLVSPSCDLFKYVSADNKSYPEPFPTYVGVVHPSSTSTPRGLTYQLLAYLTGDKMSNTSKDQCEQLNKNNNQQYAFLWMGVSPESGVCVRSQTIRMVAISPAFTSDYMSDGTLQYQDLYSTWTESQWQTVSARIFVIPSLVQQWLTLVTGILVLILSFVVVYLFDKKSDQLFDLIEGDLVTEQTIAVGC